MYDNSKQIFIQIILTLKRAKMLSSILANTKNVPSFLSLYIGRYKQKRPHSIRTEAATTILSDAIKKCFYVAIFLKFL